MFMQAPVTFSGTARIYFKCHLCGVRSDGSFKTATLWGAKIYAAQMSSLTKQ
jgi:hypothetical protein